MSRDSHGNPSQPFKVCLTFKRDEISYDDGAQSTLHNQNLV